MNIGNNNAKARETTRWRLMKDENMYSDLSKPKKNRHHSDSHLYMGARNR